MARTFYYVCVEKRSAIQLYPASCVACIYEMIEHTKACFCCMLWIAATLGWSERKVGVGCHRHTRAAAAVGLRVSVSAVMAARHGGLAD